MSEPISPDKIGEFKKKLFPDYVMDAFNELIAADFSNGSARVTQDDVIKLILSKANDGLAPDDFEDGAGLTRRQVFDRGYLNVEEVYRAAGWVVHYDKPGYNENYDAFFEFKKGRKNG